MRLLGDGPVIDTDKNGNNVPELVNLESVLLHCNVAHNDYLQNSKLLYTDSIFDHIEIWFTDQNNNSLQIEDGVSVTLIIQTKT